MHGGMGAGRLDGDSTACSLDAGVTGSLEADGPAAWKFGGLAAWMLIAMMMRMGMRMLINDDTEEGWKEF